MSEVKWTDAQQDVINDRDNDLLVSAAAGSGKTAVLVERIVNMISDEKNPVDIDRFLVVTFTEAAAAQMRDKLTDKLRKKIMEDPSNIRLRKQVELVNSAHISTIHGFCLYVIKNYFASIDFDPDFRVADEAEKKLMIADIMSELMEDKYDEADDEFLDLVECFGGSKNDDGIENYCLSLFDASQSEINPVRTLKSWGEKLNDQGWTDGLFDYVLNKLKDIYAVYEQLREVCMYPDGPDHYLSTIDSDMAIVEQLMNSSSYKELLESKNKIADFDDLSRKKNNSPYRESVKNIRDGLKKETKSLMTSYIVSKDQINIQDTNALGPMRALVDLTIDFANRYEEKKRDLKLIDFSDMEHLALKILIGENGDEWREPARELSEFFVQVMTDEYQDSNLLQDKLLEAVSGKNRGVHNIFCVGDIKQSIYGFRKARPELFVEKYVTYGSDNSVGQKRIDLQMNFRSDIEVVDTVNKLFDLIMTKKTGGIDYTDDQRLNLGLNKSSDYINSKASELWVIEKLAKDNNPKNITAHELEASVVATRIKEMCTPGNNFFGDRDLTFSDIAILLRSPSNTADTFETALRDAGVPVLVQVSSGYFDATEIAQILDLLRIIDNPNQDIPMASVLHSLMFEFTAEEMLTIYPSAVMDKQNRNGIWKALKQYSVEGSNKTLRLKCHSFADILEDLRFKASYMSISEIIDEALTATGWELICAARSDGDNAIANINILKAQALRYETTSFSGLFDFTRYIDELKKFDYDQGPASLNTEGSNAVRILSIHKSKGLEYPVCIIANADKSFNTTDSKNSILINEEFGPVSEVRDRIRRTKFKTVKKNYVASRIKDQLHAEEQRLLYVALTRAMNKVIVSGTVNSIDNTLYVKRTELGLLGFEKVPEYLVSRSNSYLDLILYAQSIQPSVFNVVPFNDHIIKSTERADAEKLQNKYYELIDEDRWELTDEDDSELDKTLEYIYPHEGALKMHRKFSVSELKKRSADTELAHQTYTTDEDVENDDTDELADPQTKSEQSADVSFWKKEIILEEGVTAGAAPGTAAHRAFELLDYEIDPGIKSVNDFLDGLVADKVITQETRGLVRPHYISDFLKDDIAKRMNAAKKNGSLKREARFILSIPAGDIILKDGPVGPVDENCLIQGVIDACFIEDGKWVLLDYKTDFIDRDKSKVEEGLRVRYKTQLDLYERALEQMTGIKVSERLIWSCRLGKCISI